MRLNLGELQKVVNRTLDEEKAAQALKSEIGRVLGPSVVTEGKFVDVVAAANDHLDVLDRTGRSGLVEFKSTLVASFLDYRDSEVRKFAARVCPEKYLPRMKNDRSPEVRAAVAARLSPPAVREMMRRFPQDDQLRVIFRQKKRLLEAGLPKPAVEPMGHDPVEDAERMGDVARTAPGLELSDSWYHQLAMKFLHDMGRNIEYAWEELAVRRYCASTKATSGVEVDETKLLKCIKDMIEEKEDDAMERDALKETLSWLKAQETQDNLNEGVLPDLSEDVDPVRDLMVANLVGEQFLEQASKLFKVQEAMLPMSIRKYRLGEGNMRQTTVPVIGMLPHKFGFRALDERALDRFCEAWTQHQAIAGEPLKLEWTNHPTDMNKVGFTCVLK